MNLYSENQTENIHKETFAYLTIEEQNHILSITLNRPNKKNALNPQLLNELAFVFHYAYFNNLVRAILIKANGDVFSSGLDLKAMNGVIEENNSTIPEPNSRILIGELFNKLHKPKICQLEGDVYAGGLLIVAGCNYVVAKRNIVFGLPEVKRGIFPMQVMESLSKIMPLRNVIDWCIRGYNLDVEKAKDWGLVSVVVEEDEIKKTVVNWLNEVVNNSPVAIKLGLEASDKINSSESNHEYLYEMLEKVMNSSNAREGINAFKEKRKPKWS